jgi:hypothetical protein
LSYRREKSRSHLDNAEWFKWLSGHYPSLRAIGIPVECTLTSKHWIDFLQNGHLELHPESDAGFSFDKLSPDEMKTLLGILESSPKFSREPIVGWLRHRLSH